MQNKPSSTLELVQPVDWNPSCLQMAPLYESCKHGTSAVEFFSASTVDFIRIRIFRSAYTFQNCATSCTSVCRP